MPEAKCRISVYDEWPRPHWRFWKSRDALGGWKNIEFYYRRHMVDGSGNSSLVRISAPDCEVRYYKDGRRVSAPDGVAER